MGSYRDHLGDKYKKYRQNDDVGFDDETEDSKIISNDDNSLNDSSKLSDTDLSDDKDSNADRNDDNDEIRKQTEKRIKDLTLENGKLTNALAYAKAEITNILSRNKRDVSDAAKYSIKNFILDIVDVLESLYRTKQHLVVTDETRSFADGIDMTIKIFLNALAKHGVVRFCPIGEDFDPGMHIALTVIPSDTVLPGKIVDVISAGYAFNDGRLIKEASVVVSANVS